MKINIQNQFLNLRKIIQTNVSTLNELINQSDHLAKLIQSLGEAKENEEIKKQLEDSRKKISESIDVLVDQTEKLFETYDKLIEEIFGKQ